MLLDAWPCSLPIPPMRTSLSCICDIHLFSQQMFIEHLLCTRHCSRPGDTALKGADKAPSLMELTFWWGRLMSQHILQEHVLELSHSSAAHM